MPFTGKTLERVPAAILERESRSGDQILHGARHQDLARIGQ
jgi:hypothetical protein